MGTCLIPNCRKQTPPSAPFCVDHRDPPTWEQKYNAAMHNWTIDSNAKEAEIAALQSRLDAALRETLDARLGHDALALRLGRRDEQLTILRDWIQEHADEPCTYGEPDFEACGHNRKHGICGPCSASRVLAQELFISDAHSAPSEGEKPCSG